ncbi:MAG: class I SAM-dependent methyltransferase [Solirubrobacteraceae bacterium]|nr:class I SAM-dependent methyltransferase [Solirubrobacteraceae bacterium]
MSSRPRFPSAPAWYRPLLQLEDQVLLRLRDRLPTQAHLHGDDEATADYAENERLGIRSAERIVPGANASPYMVQHVGRYLWAMDAARGKHVIDLGCGDGYGTFLLSWVAASAVGIDLSASAITAAREQYSGHHAGPQYREGDLTKADQLPGSADLATCFEVLEHVPQAQLVLETAAQRVPRLLMSVPNPLAGGSHINPHHVVDWPLSKWKRVARSAGAESITAHHQSLRGYRVQRRAAPWHAFWLLDIRFSPR